MTRTIMASAVGGMLLAVAAVPAPQKPTTDPPKPAPVTSSTPPVTAVEGIGLTVRDADRSIAFFQSALDFELVSDVEVTGDDYDRQTGVFGVRLRVVKLKLGTEAIELTEFLTPRGRPYPADARSNDHWFQHAAIVVRDIDEGYKRLRKHKAEHVSPAVQTLPEWNKAAAGIRAFYFKDPDGHPLELIQFPAGKGDPRWQKPTDRLFLGIDHTAVVVGDTDASLKFYRDRLGLKVVGGGENFGPEQERLNAVFGARLRITTLKAEAGPGVELLEYLAPHGGREPPADQRANDLWHTRTLLRTRDGRTLAPGSAARDPDRHPLDLRPR
jgi:catechol 2,3-dioxygenase-like lactoylglutathione lyase family enzyme